VCIERLLLRIVQIALNSGCDVDLFICERFVHPAPLVTARHGACDRT
jgi:hypothetical protein